MTFRSSPRSVVIGLLLLGLTGLVPAAAYAQAVPVSAPISITDTNPCTGETFTGTGRSFQLVYFKPGPVNTHITVRTTTHIDATTVLPVAGVKYVANYDSLFEFEVGTGSAIELTTDVGTVFVRQGDTATTDIPTSTGDDFVAHQLIHATINANGTVTADFGPVGPFKCTR